MACGVACCEGSGQRRQHCLTEPIQSSLGTGGQDQHTQKRGHTWYHATHTFGSFNRYFLSAYYLAGIMLSMEQWKTSNEKLGERSINVGQESGDAEMKREGRKEKVKGKGLERPGHLWGRSRRASQGKPSPLYYPGPLSMCFGLLSHVLFSTCTFSAHAASGAHVLAMCLQDKLSSITYYLLSRCRGHNPEMRRHPCFLCIQRGNWARLLTPRNSPLRRTVFLVREQREKDSEKSKFYRPTLHKPCIIQLQELMYDACYHHQTCAANNSCLQLLKDVLLTLWPAESDWVNSWSWMEMITPVFKILLKCLCLWEGRQDNKVKFLLLNIKYASFLSFQFHWKVFWKPFESQFETGSNPVYK